MIPTHYFSTLHNDTFEVQVIPVQPHWAVAGFGHTHRVEIGRWNFNCTHFVATAQGSGVNELAAYHAAVDDLLRGDEVGNEDAMMLGE
jgi:hypothetical protein